MDEDAFSGLRVIELAQWVSVPVAGALLADWGADVIRVERLDGDPYRGTATQGIETDGGEINLSVALANRGTEITMPTPDEVRLGYRLGVLYGFYPWGITFVVARPITGALLHRLGTAVADDA